MKNLSFIQKIKSFIVAHKVWSIVVVLIILSTTYFVFNSKTNAETRYVTSIIKKGNIVVSRNSTAFIR